MYNYETAPSFWERNRVLVKGLLVGILVLVMLIPGSFVTMLVEERQQRQAEVVTEVSSKWASKQTITGPVLMVPYKEDEKASDGKVVTRSRMAYFLPDELHITGNMQPTEKKRSIYSVMLYRSQIKLSGKFNAIPVSSLQVDPAALQWQDARIIINTSDVKGIEDQVTMDWNGTRTSLDAGVPKNDVLDQGLSAAVAVNGQGQYTFSVNLSLRGSEHLYFAPVGKTTEADLSANWKDPAFDGEYLPITSQVSDKDFKAHWKILPLSHSYPQCWANAPQDLNKAAFGVRLIQPVDGYSKTSRSVKYAILFIALTFTCFFFLEILQKRQIHPLQYILVGIALTIFYTLLLSISEYTGFDPAYLIASIATISLIGMYSWSIFKNGKTAIGFTTALALLYTYIFVLIQLEDYALLFGSIGLFLIIAVIMYYSRRIDWYGITRHKDAPPSAMRPDAPESVTTIIEPKHDI